MYKTKQVGLSVEYTIDFHVFYVDVKNKNFVVKDHVDEGWVKISIENHLHRDSGAAYKVDERKEYWLDGREVGIRD